MRRNEICFLVLKKQNDPIMNNGNCWLASKSPSRYCHMLRMRMSSTLVQSIESSRVPALPLCNQSKGVHSSTLVQSIESSEFQLYPCAINRKEFTAPPLCNQSKGVHSSTLVQSIDSLEFTARDQFVRVQLPSIEFTLEMFHMNGWIIRT